MNFLIMYVNTSVDLNVTSAKVGDFALIGYFLRSIQAKGDNIVALLECAEIICE